ncbi:MAG: hypothetical protein IIB61_06695, partial [Planctomycetes bacterium]|nr:hypothetical protein [Planctomycetota bacterium]
MDSPDGVPHGRAALGHGSRRGPRGRVTNVTIDFDDVLADLNAFSGNGYFD